MTRGNLNKSQVKAFLDVLSKDESRPVLCYAKLDIVNDRLVLVATNSYILAAVNLEASEDGKQKYAGQMVHRDDLTRWYKLANTKDNLTTEEILLMSQPAEVKYPKWLRLFYDDKAELLEGESVDRVTFNSNFALTLEKVAGSPLTYTFHGDLGPMVATTSNGLYCLMPLKSN